MAEQNVEPNNLPVFRMQKMYVKDLSFENPNSPKVFLIPNQEPKVEFNLKLRHQKIDDDHYEVSLNITAKITDGKNEDTVMFIVEIEHAGVFLLKNIPVEHLQRVLAVDCPLLLFPFTRQVVSQLSVDGGFMPFLMEPINFPALYENRRQQQEKSGNA